MPMTTRIRYAALLLLTTACLMTVVVIERAERGVSLLSVEFRPQDDGLDKVYADALKQAASDDAIESSGFQLANLELDPFAVKQSSRASKPISAPATRTPTAAAIPMVSAPEPVPVVAASVVSAPLVSASPAAGESDGEVAAEKMAEHRAERGKRLLGAAKDLEKAAHYEMESAKGRFDVRSLDVRSHKSMQPHSILSAMSDELKKLSHLNSDTTTKETAGASLDGTDVHAMAVETKKLDTLVRALKGGKTFEDITMTEQAHVPDGEGENVKLSDSSARSDLDTFFDGMSRLEKTDHDVGDTYDKLQTPQKIELKMQQKKIDQLEKLVLGLATSKSSLGVHSGRVGMGMQVKAQAVVRGNSAYASILHAAQQSELPELHARLDNTPQGLKGVNLKDWYNDRVEKASEDAMLVGNRFADRTAAAGLQYDDVPGFMNADEGGSQLASFALPTKVKCPACGFLPSCKVNPQSLGFSRATGTFGSYPSAQATGAQDAYGGGREDGSTHPAHTATLRQLDSGGIMQSQAPLWTELSGLLPASAHTRRLLATGELAGSVEGGQMLASFALPPKAVAAPPPKCVCPHCKLGDEQVGWEDEHHGMLAMPMGDKVDLIDEELMKLDPSYAMTRSDPNYKTYAYPFINNHAGIFAKGVANPFSDFHEDNRAYHNQVATKDAKTLW